jgi:hypothetical protein
MVKGTARRGRDVLAWARVEVVSDPSVIAPVATR